MCPPPPLCKLLFPPLRLRYGVSEGAPPPPHFHRYVILQVGESLSHRLPSSALRRVVRELDLVCMRAPGAAAGAAAARIRLLGP